MEKTKIKRTTVEKKVLNTKLKQQTVVTELGIKALSGASLVEIMQEAVSKLQESFGVEYTKILELSPDEKFMVLRAGVGWQDWVVVNQSTVDTGLNSQAGYTLHASQPVIVKDLRTEERFNGPELLTKHNVVSGLSCIIYGKDKPYGVLGIHSTRQQEFSSDDVNFLQSVANVLALAIEHFEADSELIESELRFRNLADTAPMYIAMADESGNAVYFNKPWLDFTGKKLEEMLGFGWLDTLYPEDAQRFANDFKNAFAKQIPLNEQYRFRREDGQYRWMLAVGAPRLTPEGKLVGYYGTYTDVHDLKEMQVKLAESEEQYRRLTELSPLAIAVHQDGKIVYANHAAVDLIAANDKEHLLGAKIIELVHPEFHESMKERVSQIYKGSKEHTRLIEEKLIRFDGKVIFAEIISQLVLFEGKPAIQVVARDVTERNKLQEALTYQIRLLETISNNASHGLIMMDSEQRCTFMNPAAEEITGYTFSEIQKLNMPLHDIIHHTKPDGSHYPMEECPIDRALPEKNRTKGDDVFVKKDGTFYPVSFTASPIMTNGEAVGTVIELRDATEEKQAQERLRKNEERFRLLIQNSSDVISIVDREGTITYQTETMETTFGYTQAERIGKNVLTINNTHPDDMKAKKAFFDKLLENPGKNFSTEFRLKQKDGSYIYIEAIGKNLLDEPSIQGIILNYRDISERRLAEERSQFLMEATNIISSSLDYKTVLSNIAKLLVPQMADWYSVVIKEEDGTLTTTSTFHKDPQKVAWAQEIAEKYPTDPNAPLGVPNVIRTSKSEIYPEITDDMLVASAIDTEHLKLMREVGFKSVMIVPLIVRGKAVGALSLITTESDRHYDEDDLIFAEDLAGRIAISFDNAKLYNELEKRVEERTRELLQANTELQRSNAELQDFAYVASHDLQEPLRKITSFSNLLETRYKDDLPETAQTYLDAVKRSSMRMSTLINDLLTYSRVTTQSKPFESVDLDSIVKTILDDLEPRIEERHAEICYEEICTIEGDPLQMHLLFQNLISNALKYSKPDQTSKIKICGKKKKGYCIISVEDNGIGFDEIYLDRIFTIFQRLHSRNEYEGTGIGLAICKKIVDRHNGEITAKSKEGVGSTFIVKLPIQQL